MIFLSVPTACCESSYPDGSIEDAAINQEALDPSLCYPPKQLLPFFPDISFASANVPLNHWSYRYLDKMASYGLVVSEIKGARPHSRMNMARLIVEAVRNKESNRIDLPEYIERLLKRLSREFSDEMAVLQAGVSDHDELFIKPLDEAELRYVYSQGEPREHRGFPHRRSGIDGYEGTPLVQNNNGVVYGQKHNATFQFSSRMRWTKYFSANVEPIVLLRQNENNVRDIDAAKVDLLKGYVKLNLWNFELEVGRDSLWWGPGYHGSLLMTNNAKPFDMLKISNPAPFNFPWIFKYIGPTKFTFFMTRLEDDRYIAEPTLAGLRLNIKPFPLLEIGASGLMLVEGDGQPKYKFDDSAALEFGSSQGDKMFSLDARLRIPYLWNTEVYVEYAGEDGTTRGIKLGSPEWVYGDIAFLAGLYIPSITSDGRLDFRFEYAQTAIYYESKRAFWYGHSIYRSGNTYNGLIYGHHMGGGAHDVFSRITYAPLNEVIVGLDVDWTARGVNSYLSPTAEYVTQLAGDVTYDYSPNLTFFSRLGYENVKNYNMVKNDNRNNFLFIFSSKYNF